MSLSVQERAALRKVFRMPSVQTMVTRKSSITNAFVNSIVPVIPPDEEEIQYALSLLGMNPQDIRCVYCGDRATEWDHLRPLVENRRPTGYMSEIRNLVPSCSKCNQSKGNKYWEKWMCSDARLSPARRGIADLDARIDRIRRYEQWGRREPVDFKRLLGEQLWEEHWGNLDRVVEHLEASQELADRIRTVVVEWVQRSTGANGT